MTTTIRKIAVAAIAALASFCAYADLVTFESLSVALNADKADGTPVDPLPVTDQFAGFLFSGATAFSANQTGDTNYCCAKPGGTHAGDVFIQSLTGAGANVRSVDVNAVGTNAGRDIVGLTFDLALVLNKVRVLAWVDGATDPTQVFESVAGDGSFNWNTQQISFANLGPVNRIEFNSSADGTLFALDNLDFTFAAPGGGGGTAPEPASYALVAMALLAAGGASRRRKA